MILRLVILLMIAGTVAILLWPLMRAHAATAEHRAITIIIFIVLILLPAGSMILYFDLGAPQLAGKTQTQPAAESEADLVAEAAEATRAVQNNPSIETYNHLGNILFRMGNYKAATKAYEQAAHLDAASRDQNNGNAN